jgi:hypothetical protein
MITSDRKVRKMMAEFAKTGNVTMAALRADMDRKTAKGYIEGGKLPSEKRQERDWKTREDPFQGVWEEAEGMLRSAPELEAKALFEWICERHPGEFEEGQMRTFQRRVRDWRALEGPQQEVYFPQEHEPGVRMETDFTRMTELGITIGGSAFPHLLCHSVLAYSNWEWATVCASESLLALREGLQAMLRRLGAIPREQWTDHSTAATHWIGSEGGKERAFNGQYLEVMKHFGIKPRTIQVRKPHENGDVESAHKGLKRRVDQHLLLLGHRDFAGVKEYTQFLVEVMERANRLRGKRLAEELAVMRPLDVSLLPEYIEEESRVTSWSTVQILRNTYSVPSRLRGHMVRAKVYEDRVEMYFHGVHQVTCPRLRGETNHSINYRHVISSLVRKPGAFRLYKYREDMFPSSVFRWAYDSLSEECSERTADKEYLRILNHAAQTMESTVEQALESLRQQKAIPRWESVLKLTGTNRAEVPDLQKLPVDLSVYDHLLGSKEVLS